MGAGVGVEAGGGGDEGEVVIVAQREGQLEGVEEGEEAEEVAQGQQEQVEEKPMGTGVVMKAVGLGKAQNRCLLRMVMIRIWIQRLSLSEKMEAVVRLKKTVQ